MRERERERSLRREAPMGMYRELAAEQEGVEDLKRYLHMVTAERDALKKALDKQMQVVDHLHSVKSFDKEHAAYMETVNNHYQKVRAKHKEACEILSRPDTFNYHAVYRRHGDQFSSSSWTPPALHVQAPRKSMAQAKVDKYRKSPLLPSVANHAAAGGDGPPHTAR